MVKILKLISKKLFLKTFKSFSFLPRWRGRSFFKTLLYQHYFEVLVNLVFQVVLKSGTYDDMFSLMHSNNSFSELRFSLAF